MARNTVKFKVYDIDNEGLDDPMQDDISECNEDTIEETDELAAAHEWVDKQSEEQEWSGDHYSGSVLVVGPDEVRTIYSYEWDCVPRTELRREN